MDTTIDKPVAAAPFRHPFEEFSWLQWDWDIAKLQRDIDAGVIKPERITVNAEFIAGYATGVLALDRDPALCTKYSLIMRINVKEALALPLAALDEPLIMLHTPRKGKGVLRLEGQDQANHVLADGNHRIARAFFENRPSLDVYVLTSPQSRKYLTA